MLSSGGSLMVNSRQDYLENVCLFIYILVSIFNMRSTLKRTLSLQYIIDIYMDNVICWVSRNYSLCITKIL